MILSLVAVDGWLPKNFILSIHLIFLHGMHGAYEYGHMHVYKIIW